MILFVVGVVGFNMIYIYKIVIDGETRYIGRTNNISKREYTHNYLFRKGKKKELYDKVRENHPYVNYLKLEVIGEFKKDIDAKRMECYLILHLYFLKRGQLYQKVPNISDF